jgi:hypothetical protein
MNDKLSRFEKTIVGTMDKLIHKVQGMEGETKEMNEKITEIQIKVSEIDRKESIRKPHRSSESDEESPRKRKPSDSSSSNEENSEVNT